MRSLVEAGILEVQPASDGMAYQENVLTPKAENLFPVVVLRQCGEQHVFDPCEAHSQLVETSSGKPLGMMQPVAASDRVLAPDETSVKKFYEGESTALVH